MAFMDEVQKSVNQMAQATVKKSSELIEIGKLKLSLNQAQIELDELYQRIGKVIYTEKIKNVTDSEVVVRLMKQVTDQRTIIQRIEKQINDVKGIKVCEKCKAYLETDAQICPRCLSPQSDTVDWRL